MQNHRLKKLLSLAVALSLLAGCSLTIGVEPRLSTAPVSAKNTETMDVPQREEEPFYLKPSAEDSKEREAIPTLEEAGLGILDPSPRELSELVTFLPAPLEELVTPVNSQADTDMGTFGASGEKPSETGESTVSTTAPSSTGKGGLSGAMPTFDIALKGDKKFRVKVNAPSGAKVQATINGKTYGLTETAKASGIGVYQGRFSMPDASGTHDLGQISYSMTHKGTSDSLKSEGKLFAVSTNSTLLVQVKNTSATAFKNPKSRASGTYITTMKKGAVDSVKDFYGDMYYLSTVGWVDASAVTPLTTGVSLTNAVSSTSYTNTGEGEVLTLSGTSHPPYRTVQNNDKIAITFSRTTGVGNISLADSRLFSDAAVSSSNGATTITFTLKKPGTLWGYVVEYNGGNTTVLFREKKTITNPDLPLEGITAVVDPGHGGKDQGAPGLGGNGRGPVEKEINLATSLILLQELESKGATVIMTRASDKELSLSQRLAIAQGNRADFMVSIHCNSAANPQGKGVEVFYYDSISRSLASSISSSLSASTNRVNRGGKHSCYVITLNSYAPSVLVEMGFMTNASDYANLQTQEAAAATAQSITQSIIAELS